MAHRRWYAFQCDAGGDSDGRRPYLPAASARYSRGWLFGSDLVGPVQERVQRVEQRGSKHWMTVGVLMREQTLDDGIRQETL